MKYCIVFGSVVLAASMGGCSSADKNPGAHSFQVTEEDGVRIAESNAVPKFKGDLFQYEKVLVIQPDPEIPASVLYRPRLPLLKDELDRFHIVDGADMRIAVFDSEGNYLFQYGKEGAGPGEFRGIYLQSIRDGLVSVYDHSLFRTTVFTTSGDLVEVFPAPNPSPLLRRCEKLSNGTIVSTINNPVIDDRCQSERNILVVFSAEGDTTAHFQTPLVETMFTLLDEGRSTGFFSALPFRALPTVALIPPDRVFMTVGYTPEIRIFNLSGELTDLIKVDFVPSSITSAERRKVIDEYGKEDEYINVYPSPEFIQRAKKAIFFPEQKSCWEHVYVDDKGYYWLQQWESAFQRFLKGGSSFKVLSPEGEYIGDTRWPGQLGVIAGDLLLSYEMDWGTGELIPVVFRLTPQVDGFEYPTG